MSSTVESAQIAVIGLGRFGSFWAGMLAGTSDVVGTSRRTIEHLPSGVRQVSIDEALNAPIVCLAVTIGALPQVLQEIAPHLRPDALVFDTCSVKMWPVEQMQRYLPETCEIVATHPMFGPDSAFGPDRRLPLIAWPVRCGRERFERLCDRFSDLGMVVHELSPEEHDREAAFTQGVTHLVGRILDEMQLGPSEIGTLGYRRLLEVKGQTCNDPLELFLDLQRYNPFTRQMRGRFTEALSAIETLLGSRAGDASSGHLDDRGSSR